MRIWNFTQISDKTSTITGFEITVAHAFTYLPGFLSGLGGKISSLPSALIPDSVKKAFDGARTIAGAAAAPTAARTGPERFTGGVPSVPPRPTMPQQRELLTDPPDRRTMGGRKKVEAEVTGPVTAHVAPESKVKVDISLKAQGAQVTNVSSSASGNAAVGSTGVQTAAMVT